MQNRTHNYLDPLGRLLAQHQSTLAQPGRVTEARIVHDSWCPRLSGGICACNPEIVLVDQTGESSGMNASDNRNQ
jgi:hypothetical protein